MEIMLLLKDLLIQKELLGMFLFTFIILSIVFKDISTVAKVLRKPLLIYTILIMTLNYVK